MTALICLDLVEQFSGYKTGVFVHLDAIVKIPLSVVMIGGTSAKLIGNDCLTIKRLLYAMMLPSGNDAAQALAIWFGAILLHDRKIDPNIFLHTITESEIDDYIQTLT